MAHLTPRTSTSARECAALAMLTIALVILLPLLGMAAFLLRGAVVTAFALAVAALAGVALWKWLYPTRPRATTPAHQHSA